jgi:tocopherol O-methyltransferase
MATNPAIQQLDDIIDYYDQTRFDYNIAWLNEENLAVHFGFYDRKHQVHEQALQNTNKVLSSLAAVQAGDCVLDAGCGKGGSAFWLAHHKQAKVIGISPVKTQIEEARSYCQQKGLSTEVSFMVGDYCQVPLPEASFDVIWACESLCHAQQKAKFYQEAYRLLRPGGRLIIAEYVRQSRNLTNAQESLLLDWLNRWAIPDIDTTEEHHAHLQEAGFNLIQIDDYTPYTWISLKNLYKIARRWIWADYILYAIKVRSKEQHNNIVGSIKQYKALKQGLWYYAVISAEKNASL